MSPDWQFKMRRAHHGRTSQWWEEQTDACLSDLKRSRLELGKVERLL